MFDGAIWQGECWDPAHGHPVESSAVINCFNLDDRAVTRYLDLDPGRVSHAQPFHLHYPPDLLMLIH